MKKEILAIQKLRRLHKAATPGQWGFVVESNVAVPHCRIVDGAFTLAVINGIADRAYADAEFIVIAHNTMPQLIEGVMTLEAIKARLNGIYDHPYLKKVGALSEDVRVDIGRILGWYK